MKNGNLKICMVALTLVLLALPAAAAPNQGPWGMSWDNLDKANVGYTLRISGPDGVQDFTFGPNEKVAIGLDQVSADGQYTYEVTRVVARGRTERGTEAVSSKRRGAVDSGYFTIAGGQFVTDTEEVVAKDIVHLDDVIIDGSACIGFDCANGENFGFDTLRLKENNLRIKFDDTSNSASFPANDWQLTANDSSSGGANRFSIDDVTGGRTPFNIEAGAPSSSLYVDDGGRIGVGTSTPVVEVHIKDGDTPTLRLEQDGSSGFTAQTWDVAGNETNWFVRDATNGSRIPFKIRPTAPTDSIYINTDGKVGFLDTSPEQNLKIFSAAAADAIIGLGNNAGFPGSDAFVFGYNGTAGGQAFIGTRATTQGGDAGTIRFAVENTTEMTLKSDGLHVEDAIFVGAQQLSVPDYVFGDEYQLRSIDELANFVATEKHLPGVPSESEIKNGGLDLAGFQMRLLEKVEELTLYTLDQHESLQQLSEENAQLRARLTALEEATK